MKILNLGILAHVDAGKTSLTERLLFNAGIIDQIGSVDAGNTQTDSLALERQRGITIKTAAVSFTIGDATVNLLDTPGHPDFIAEVERVLNVLDAAVLVISAVEGIQAQTHILMRALQRLNIPTIIFVNKIDRLGAHYDDLLNEIADRLTPNALPMGIVKDAGKPTADFLPYNSSSKAISGSCPVFAGSAITGAGVKTLAAYLPQLAKKTLASGKLSGAVFKVERGAAGEKIAYVRLFSGTIENRDTIGGNKVTAISVFEHGATVRKPAISAGQIGKLWNLNDVQVGDGIGEATKSDRHFAPPTLETVIRPVQQSDKTALYTALAQLAEQDPLINLRQDDAQQVLYVSLYGEVQKEVIQAALHNDFGIAVEFDRSSTIYVERIHGVGEAVEVGKRYDPFLATIGLRVEPGAPGGGVKFQVAQEVIGTMPLAFFKAVGDTVYQTLQQGLYGWSVIDCVVTMTNSGYFPRQSHSHAKFDKSMSSTGADFRGLTPLVLMDAVKKAGTTVHEPLYHFELEIPERALMGLLPVLGKFGAVAHATEARGATYALSGDIPAARVHELQQQLPALTNGEGVLEYFFDRYEPVHGAPPTRKRTDNNPLDRRIYIQRVSRNG